MKIPISERPPKMLRSEFQTHLKTAMHNKDEIAVGTIRLILAALKDRDIAARAKGNYEGIADDDILSLLQTMVKQRLESIAMYEKGGRAELAAREEAEMRIIQKFMPTQLSEAEVTQAIQDCMVSVSAQGMKDMGKVMADLKAKYTGRIDFAKISPLVKDALAKL